MSQKSKVIFGALAVAATLGAVQFAAGQDLTEGLAGRFQALSEPPGAASIPQATGINRTAKTDREPVVAGTAGPARTVSMKVESLADTSILIRIPVEKEARNLQPSQPGVKPPAKAGTKRMVACEPVVSVLTEVAKLLQPGKCVT
jgi:hypothetical protein